MASSLLSARQGSVPCLYMRVNEEGHRPGNSSRPSSRTGFPPNQRQGGPQYDLDGRRRFSAEFSTTPVASWQLRNSISVLRQNFEALCSALGTDPRRLREGDVVLSADQLKLEREFRRMAEEFDRLKQTLIMNSTAQPTSSRRSSFPTEQHPERYGNATAHYYRPTSTQPRQQQMPSASQQEDSADSERHALDPPELDIDMEVLRITTPHPESPACTPAAANSRACEPEDEDDVFTSRIPRLSAAARMTPLHIQRSGRSMSVVGSVIHTGDLPTHFNGTYTTSGSAAAAAGASLNSGRNSSVDLGRYATPLTTYRMSLLGRARQASQQETA